jgi:CRISPR-associated protein Cas5h
MTTDKAIVFDLWGDYAHFRKIETTTSPLTYPIPSGTSLAGLISAILGLERDSYYEYFSPEHTKFSIKILNPVKKIRINLNLINTKKGFFLWDIKDNPRTLIPFEFVKDPKYRIYFYTQHGQLYQKLKTLLKNHQSFFTPYLGVSELIANFEYINEYKVESPSKTDKDIQIATVIRKDKAHLKINEDSRYGLERIPLYMDENRIVKEYADVYLEMDGNPMKIITGEYCTIGSENVIFF